MDKRVEYMYFFGRKVAIEDIRSALNAHGKKGWRLVDRWEAPDPNTPSNDMIFWLEREVAEEG